MWFHEHLWGGALTSWWRCWSTDGSAVSSVSEQQQHPKSRTERLTSMWTKLKLAWSQPGGRTVTEEDWRHEQVHTGFIWTCRGLNPPLQTLWFSTHRHLYRCWPGWVLPVFGLSVPWRVLERRGCILRGVQYLWGWYGPPSRDLIKMERSIFVCVVRVCEVFMRIMEVSEEDNTNGVSTHLPLNRPNAGLGSSES